MAGVILVAVLVAVWAALTFEGWYRRYPEPATAAREPGWALRDARARRDTGVRVIGPAIARHHPGEPRRPTWTVRIPDAPTETLPLNLTETWPSPWDGTGTTMQLQAVR